MNLEHLIRATAQPYSSLLQKLNINGLFFTSRSLPFNMHAQTESNWCWAATSTSVSHFYWTGSTWTQCRVAGAELGLNNCCQAPTPGPCNVPWYLDRALTRTHNFVNISGPTSFAQVEAEINAGRPVGARIGWSGGGGHFMCIYGYATVAGTQYFDIDDPIYGKSHLTVADFSNHYQGSGRWTHSYLTQSYLPFMLFKPFLLKDDILRRIWETRPLLDVKAGAATPAAGGGGERALGLAHEVYALGLQELASGEGRPEPVCVRVLELEGTTARALFDVASAEDVAVRQMSATSPYLQLFPRAMEVAAALPARERTHELRLLRVPALNFEALWLHAGDRREDRVIPLRGFHGFTPMETISYEEALERLRGPAEAAARQEDTMGA